LACIWVGSMDEIDVFAKQGMPAMANQSKFRIGSKGR
jgi:hypothetical protein